MVLDKFFIYNAGPNKALIKSTGDIAIGRRLHALPAIHRIDTLGLELRTIIVHTAHGTTINGVPVHVTACCQVKIQGWSFPTPTPTPSPAASAATSTTATAPQDLHVDYDAVRLAAQHFIGKTDAQIDDSIHRTVEGHQRAIISTLTVEQLYRDRPAFSRHVRHLCKDDLRNMGLAMVSYTVSLIADDNGYMEALGVTQTEHVKREAAEGTALHRSMAMKVKGQYNAAAHLKVNRQRERELQSDKRLRMTRVNAQRDVDRAVAVQRKAGKIENEQQNGILFVKRQQAQAALIESEREVMAIKVEKARLQREIDVFIPADAQLYKSHVDADITRIRSAAKADRIRIIAAAQGDTDRALGKFESKTLGERLLVWKERGTHAALMEQMVDILPTVAAEIAAPLGKTEKFAFIGSEGSGD